MFINFEDDTYSHWTPEKTIAYTLSDILKDDSECDAYIADEDGYIQKFVSENTNAGKFYSHMVSPLHKDVVCMIQMRLMEAHCAFFNNEKKPALLKLWGMTRGN